VHNSGKEERKLRQRKMEREEKRRDREIMWVTEWVSERELKLSIVGQRGWGSSNPNCNIT
jgi:hypothetical protein